MHFWISSISSSAIYHASSKLTSPQHRLIPRGLEKIKLETAVGALCGAQGCNWIGCEFEEKFLTHTHGGGSFGLLIGLDRASSQLLQCNLQHCTQSANVSRKKETGENFGSSLDSVVAVVCLLQHIQSTQSDVMLWTGGQKFGLASMAGSPWHNKWEKEI